MLGNTLVVTVWKKKAQKFFDELVNHRNDYLWMLSVYYLRLIYRYKRPSNPLILDDDIVFLDAMETGQKTINIFHHGMPATKKSSKSWVTR